MPDWTFFDPVTRRARQHFSGPYSPESDEGMVVVEGRWLASDWVLNEDGEVVSSPLAPPVQYPPTPSEIKIEASRRLARTDWYVTRHMETGEPIPEEVLAERAHIRSVTDQELPIDYREDKWWIA